LGQEHDGKEETVENINSYIKNNQSRSPSASDFRALAFIFALIFFEKFKCDELIYYIVEKARVKKRVLYDDDTLEEMKRYYKIDNHDELLRFIKTHGLKNDDSEVED
jgi:hypothetical protein